MSQLLLLVSWFVKDNSYLKVGLLFILILVLVQLTFIAIVLPSQFVLLAAWVCVLIYMDIFKTTTPAEDSKADFFKGITIFSWVMTILLTLTFVLSFDKLCGQSSRWTLTVRIDTFSFN